MAQKPVANALILELEPVVDENLTRHLESEDIWFAHDYVPVRAGRELRVPRRTRLGPVAGHAAQAHHRCAGDPAHQEGQPRRLPPRVRLQLHPRGEVGPLAGPVDRRGAPARDRAAQLPRRHPRDRSGRQRGRPRRARHEGLPRRHLQPGRAAGVHGVLRARVRGLLPQPRSADHRAGAERPRRPDRQGRGAPRGVLPQPRRAPPRLPTATRRSRRSHAAPPSSTSSAPTSTPTRTRCATSPTRASSTTPRCAR